MKYIIVMFLCCSSLVYSQSNTTIGWIPKINSSIKINDNLKIINGVEARETFFNEDFKFIHNLVDVSSIASINTSLNHSLNIGFVLRISNEKPIYRFLQHYNIIHSINNTILAHRMGFEQFYSSIKPKYRARYRATFQRSLEGEKIDANEYYLKLGNEYLWDFNKQDFEIRFSPHIGYKQSKNSKFEVGIDYRVNSFINNATKNRFWIITAWYIQLN